MGLFGIGIDEVFLMLVIALLVVGPRRLPEIARTLGEVVRKLKAASAELSRNIQAEIDNEASDIREGIHGMDREVKSALVDTTRTSDQDLDALPEDHDKGAAHS